MKKIYRKFRMNKTKDCEPLKYCFESNIVLFC